MIERRLIDLFKGQRVGIALPLIQACELLDLTLDGMKIKPSTQKKIRAMTLDRDPTAIQTLAASRSMPECLIVLMLSINSGHIAMQDQI